MTVVPDPYVITTQTMSLAEHLVGVYEDVHDNSTNETSVFGEIGEIDCSYCHRSYCFQFVPNGFI